MVVGSEKDEEEGAVVAIWQSISSSLSMRQKKKVLTRQPTPQCC
jgi:hypothetical protein